LDRHDIAAAEAWEARLGALILGSDTVVFILSPAAVRSERCAWEVERATELGKLLVPIQGTPVADAEVPEQLRRLNYIFFREVQSFARPLRELAEALRQDVEWIREHARLSEAAARERAQANFRRVQRRWFAILMGLAVVVVLGTAAGLWSVFNGWRDLMTSRAQFIAGIVDQQTGKGDHVGAIVVWPRCASRPNQHSIRQRVLRLDMSAVNALDTAWRNWSSGWGERTLLEGHVAGVMAAAFSPDGTQVLTGAQDKTARLATGETVATLAGHIGIVWAVALFPDGTRVLTGSWDHTARLWSVFKSTQDLIDTVRASVPRFLTPAQREAFHLGTPTPRWCYERNLWPYADHGPPSSGGGAPPYGPPPPTWDEKLLAAWDLIGSWFRRSSNDPR
jgi:hypothetical protein